MNDIKKNLELKKHVATIHSSNKLSLIQRKISNALLYNAYDDLLIKDEHIIHIADLCKLIGYDSHDHKTIRRALVDLLSTVLEWNIVDGNRLIQGDEGVWNASSIIADASIDGPICTYSYSNKMKHLLHRPEIYGRLNMAVQARFKSSYGLALYENCIRFQDIGQTPWFDMVKFRKLMGIDENKYKVFRDFKCRVLDKAINEVNVYSPIQIKNKFQKQGRQVISIQFLITSDKKENEELIEKPLNLTEILKNQFAFSKKQITDILSNYKEDYIFEKIALVESSSSFKSGKINNLAKYLLSAIKEDYQFSKSNIVPKYTSAVHVDNVNVKNIKIMDSINKLYQAYRNQFVDKVIEDLEVIQKNHLMEKFFNIHAEAIDTTIRLLRKKYTKENVTDSPQIKALLRTFIVNSLPEKFLEIQPINEFVLQLPLNEQKIWKIETTDRVE